jgi:hypothetical protein
MTWTKEHKFQWRIAELMLLLVALAGPWSFDLINVPAQYPCSAPNIRLEGDFCGTPLPMTWVLTWVALGVVRLPADLAGGTAGMSDLGFVLFGLLVVLPLFTTSVLVLHGDRRPVKAVGMGALAFAASAALFAGLSGFPHFFSILWGVWLFAGVAACALCLEVLTLVGKTRPASAQ